MPANRVGHSRRMSEKGPDSALRPYRPHDRSCLVSGRELATTAGRGTAICARAAKTVLPPACGKLLCRLNRTGQTMNAYRKLTADIVGTMILRPFSGKFVGIRDRNRRGAACTVPR